MRYDVSCTSASTITQLVCRYCIPASRGAIPHVLRRIDEFVMPFLCHETLTAACEEGASVHTLAFLFEHVAPVWKQAVRATSRGGHLHVLRWMTERQDGRGPWKADFNGVLEIAAAHGHLELVQWLYARGMDWHTLWSMDESSPRYVEKSWRYKFCSSDALKAAAEHGHLEVVQWIHGVRTDVCRTYASPLDRAVANGHLAVAQWLHSQTGSDHCSIDAVDAAATKGHLEMLQWLESKNVFECSTSAMDGAAENGHLELVKWLKTRNKGCSTYAPRMAVSNGHLDVAKWLCDNYRFDLNFTFYRSAWCAVENGDLDSLQWLEEHAPAAFTEHNMDTAAANGHLHVFKWLHDHRHEGCTTDTPFYAASHGHLDILQFLHVHYSAKFDTDPIDGAARSGHFEVVQWLHENRPEGCTTHALKSAAYQGHLDVVLYLLEHRTEGFPGPAMQEPQNVEVLCLFDNAKSDAQLSAASSDVEQLQRLKVVFEQRPAFFRGCLRCLVEIAVARGNVEILDWANQFGMELLSATPIREAVGRGDWKLLEWFHENGFQVLEPDLLELAVEKGQLDVTRWLSSRGYEINSPRLAEFAGKNENVPLMRWLVEHGPPLSLSVAAMLAKEYRLVETTWWLAESDRVQLVLAALREEDRELLWWLLTRTRFENEYGRGRIRGAVQRASTEIQLWLMENVATGGWCSWDFGEVSTDNSFKRRS